MRAVCVSPFRQAAHWLNVRNGMPSVVFKSSRALTTGRDVAVNVEHVRDEWKGYGGLEGYQPGKFEIKCLDKISPKGLDCLSRDKYCIVPDDSEAENAHAILLEGHKLKEEEVSHTVRAVARCGAGTTNIPVARLTELGIPVFNTPGANANAVKELILCSLLLGSRRIVEGISHMKDLGRQGLARERVEKDKAMFGGKEMMGKTLAVIGLGHIGSGTAEVAATMGMKVVGYDPAVSVKAALSLPQDIRLADSISSAVADADYVVLIIPYIEGKGGTCGIIDASIINDCKSDAVFLNFGPSELVDSEAMKSFLDDGDGRYITDFPDDLLWDHPNCIVLPHLGGSTAEAGEAAASMAAETIRDFLETGTVRNSVNFPNLTLPDRPSNCVRFTVVNRNVPGALASITEAVAKAGLNIVQQLNQSRGPVAYTVVDIDTTGHENDVMCFKKTQENITMGEGVLSSRVIYGQPGTGYAKNVDGKYFV